MNLREKVANLLIGEGLPKRLLRADRILSLTEADARERERKAFVAGREDILESAYDEEMALLAIAEAARRYGGKL